MELASKSMTSSSDEPGLLSDSAALDAPEPKPARRFSWRRWVVVAIVLGAGATGLVAASRPLKRSIATKDELYRTTRTRFAVTTSARGELESSKSRAVINTVEGSRLILFIKPDGAMVEKGELVCELDSSALRDQLPAQLAAVSQAEATLDTAIKNRELAEIALAEYSEGTFPQTHRNVEISVTLAEVTLSRAMRNAEWSTKMAEQGFVTQAQKTADQDSARKSEYAYQLAKTQMQVLNEFTKRKSMIELEAAIKKAVSDEMSKRAVLGLEKTKLQKIQTQIEKCKLHAPTGGLLVYANDGSQRPGGNKSMIEEGASVRERQTLVRIADSSQLCVNAKVDETEISRITPGQKARVVVDALPGSALVGTVTRVEGMADLNQNNMQPEARFYTTKIEIENPPPSLRPGMATKVEILVRQVDDVIAVPPDAVLHYGGGSHVYVNSPEGLYLRNVDLGTRTKSAIEITGGLFEGEMISLRPLDHMTSDEKRDAFLTGALAHEDHWLNAQSNQ